MKRLTLVRHGKSSWEYDVPDRGRPLKKRGIKDANQVSKTYKKKAQLPDFIYSSPANRAHSTCRIFTENLKFPEESVQIIDALYDFGGNNVLEFIKLLPNTQDHIMIFGHNHAFTALANLLGDQYIENVPTSGLVQIVFDSEKWNSIKSGRTELVIFPRDLK